MNHVLKEDGFLSGEPGAYTVTDKGLPFTTITDHESNPGGTWTARWFTRAFDDSILDEIHIDDDRVEDVKAFLRERRRAQRSARELEIAPTPDDRFTGPALLGLVDEDGYIDMRKVAGALAAAALAVGAMKTYPHVKRYWIETGRAKSRALVMSTRGRIQSWRSNPLRRPQA